MTCRRVRHGATIAFAIMATAALARPTASLDGTWTGTVDMGVGQPAGTVSGALTQSGGAVTGSLTIDATAASGVFAVAGKLRGMHVVLGSRRGARRLRWKGRYDRKMQSWRGPMLERGAGGKVRAMLVLAPDRSGGPTCGNDYFASDVMPTVIEPICSRCHVPGGMAQAAAFKVTPGNAKATARSAAAQVEPGDPTHSKLVEKPRGDLPHGGGTRILPGSTEEQTLLHWIALVTAPGCDVRGGGGGGGGGTGADLYAENCASCHGPDARGLAGRPDIHCNRDISDAVRKGRIAPPAGPDGDMPAFTNLTGADVAKIQSFLDGLCPVAGVTGAELFASNCATCHGTDATGTGAAPSVRCATRTLDAMRIGRGAAMPSFAAISDPEIALVDAFLSDLCDQSGRPPADLFAGNCSTCHGATAAGGKSGLGVEGPDIRCTEAGDYTEKVRFGGDGMPSFPALGTSDVTAIVDFVRATLCAGG
jgi:mono/diheme cytochrome c family protein